MTGKMLLLLVLTVGAVVASHNNCSGKVDAVTVTQDGSTYIFEGSEVWKYEAGTSQVAADFPKSISSVFAGLPNDIDAALHYPNGKTYIFKGSQYWRFTNEASDAGYPRDIGTYWPGLPDNLDAAFVWSENNKPYFIKGDQYYRYSVCNDFVDPGYPSPLSLWNIPGNQVSAAAQWSNSRTYFFNSNGDYYRYNDGRSNVDAGYPLGTATHWQTCSCSGKVDAVTVTQDGSTYIFERITVWKYEAGTSQVAAGFPKSISSVFAGLPNDIDAALHYPNGKTYIFKGSQYWRLTNEAMDDGYPLDIGTYWPGLPDNLDAAFVWSGNNKLYFIKGDQYYRYSVSNDCVDPGYPSPLSLWNIPGNQVSAAAQWTNSRTYFFNSNGDYYRYNDGRSNVDAGYPLDTATHWQTCSCLGKVDAVTVTQDGSTYIFERINVWKYEAGTGQVAAGFPKSISSVFAGLPNDIDAALHYPNGKTYIFKGSQYWRLTNEAMDDGYPLDIGTYWPGLPDNLDAAFVWSGNNKPYFIKGDQYYRYSVSNDCVDPGYPSPLSLWNIPGNQVSAAAQWTNSRTYFFNSNGDYYRYNDGRSNVDAGYPLNTATRWQTCSCSGKVDAVTVTQDGSTYIFERITVWKYEAGTSQVAADFPKSISSVFAGLPNNIDAALHYPNGKTYIFKGSQYWRLTNEAMDDGYPRDIGTYWPGLPDNLDAAFVWSENNKPYFIKGDQYYRYSVSNDCVDPGYPSPLSLWNIPGNQVSAAVQWTNSRTYFFISNGYYRYNDGRSNVDGGYPLGTATHWQKCT